MFYIFLLTTSRFNITVITLIVYSHSCTTATGINTPKIHQRLVTAINYFTNKILSKEMNLLRESGYTTVVTMMSMAVTYR